MKNSNSRLFSKFKLNNSDLNRIVGGFYTSADSDTNMTSNRYDVIYASTNNDGEPIGNDVVQTRTSGSNLDKPVLTKK